MTLPELAPWVALVVSVLACVASGVVGWRTWKRWRRLSLTQQAASQLIAVHQARLEEAMALNDRRMGDFADGSEELAQSLAALRADAEHLRWLLQLVPTERSELKRALVDLVLWMRPDEDDEQERMREQEREERRERAR